MTEIVLYGFSGATYPWTARLVCAEKGVSHSIENVDFSTDAYRDERHPYNKMPAMQHGGVKLYESSAIARYVDAAFDGPALQPTDPVALARMEQWISVIKSYVYADMVPGYILQYLRPRGADGKPDRAAIDASAANIRYHLGILEAGIDANPFIVGDTLTLADLFVAPLLHYMDYAPELGDFRTAHPKLSAFLTTMRARPAFQETQPQEPEYAKAA